MLGLFLRRARWTVIVGAACACDSAPQAAGTTHDAIEEPTERTAADIDAEYRALDAQPGALRVVYRTRERCSRFARRAYVLWVRGRRLDLPLDAPVYFEIDTTHDEYTATGGWYWECEDGGNQTRVRGARIVKALRSSAGAIDWWILERVPQAAADAGTSP